MKTQLLIEIFEKNGECFIEEIDISHYDLKKINEICPPEDEGDFEYCNGRFLEEQDFENLQGFISELKDYKYSNYNYGIITRSIK
jgi:hypothetical protein